jgi:hypothetical protein
MQSLFFFAPPRPTRHCRIVAQDGLTGLMFRGLQTRILANGLQGLLFSVLWRAFDDALSKKKQ